VVVEAADRIQIAPLARQQFVNRRTLEFILAGADAAAGFVERDVKFAPGADRLAVHGDAIVQRIDLDAELADDVAVHRDAAVENDLFTGAPGRDAGFGEKFLQTKHDENKKASRKGRKERKDWQSPWRPLRPLREASFRKL